MFLEIGFKNDTGLYPEYDIIWFPQGTFIINSCSLSHAATGSTINLSLKDKMCLLNGECGGTLPASTQFDEYETLDENGQYIIEKPVISQIIRETINHFGGEQLGKIIISDIDDRIKMVMRWVGSSPVYLIDGDVKTLTTNFADIGENPYRMFSYGEDIGYIYTDFTYPSELIGNPGDNVCTILDKIKNTLGNYEYFYDTDGNIIFQEIRNYLNTRQATIDLEDFNKNNYLIDMSKGKFAYDFTTNPLILSYSSTPNFMNVKNDFIVWGIRKNLNGNDVPIRYHLAIDTKPKVGNYYEVLLYEDPEDGLTKATVPSVYTRYSDMITYKGIQGRYYYADDTGKFYTWDPAIVESNKYIEIDLETSDTYQIATLKTTD